MKKLSKVILFLSLLVISSTCLFGCKGETPGQKNGTKPVDNNEFLKNGEFLSVNFNENARYYTSYSETARDPAKKAELLTSGLENVRFNNAFFENRASYIDKKLKKIKFKITSDKDIDIIIEVARGAAVGRLEFRKDLSLVNGVEQVFEIDFASEFVLKGGIEVVWVSFETKETENTSEFVNFANTKYTIKNFEFYVAD